MEKTRLPSQIMKHPITIRSRFLILTDMLYVLKKGKILLEQDVCLKANVSGPIIPECRKALVEAEFVEISEEQRKSRVLRWYKITVKGEKALMNFLNLLVELGELDSIHLR